MSIVLCRLAGSSLTLCSIEGWMTEICTTRIARSVPGPNSWESVHHPKASDPSSRSAAATRPGAERRQPKIMRPAMPAFTATGRGPHAGGGGTAESVRGGGPGEGGGGRKPPPPPPRRGGGPPGGGAGGPHGGAPPPHTRAAPPPPGGETAGPPATPDST